VSGHHAGNESATSVEAIAEAQRWPDLYSRFTVPARADLRVLTALSIRARTISQLIYTAVMKMRGP